MDQARDILFGSDPTDRIVAVEVGPAGAVVYRRIATGVEREKLTFSPWLLTTEKHDLSGAEWTSLEGNGYNMLARFSSWQAYQDARREIRENHAANLAFAGAEKQYLIASGRTLFKEMSFDDIHRLQLDIETLSLSPDADDAEVFMVTISDNRGAEIVIVGSEEEILRRTVQTVRDIDPDVIEGHNIFGFDLPYLAKRAEYRGITLAMGRDGSPIRFALTRNCAIGGVTRPFRPAHIHGRHVIDTLFAVQRFDVPRGILTSHTLKDCAQTLGVAQENRVIIPHKDIAQAWRDDPETVKVYALQDVLETRSIAEIVCPSEFYVTQMAPDTYQNSQVAGTGEKINAILIRKYLAHGRAIPRATEHSRAVPGGYTEIRKTGIIEDVVKCDVESLYPSIMLTSKVKPASDTLDVFLPALAELTKRRIDAKSRVKDATGKEKAYWDGLQSSFKILINSFYGYLGAPMHFNDFDAAEKVTVTGQKIVNQIVDDLAATGSEIIEIDTDGVYFQPPSHVRTEDEEVSYIDSIGEKLPQGVRLAHDGRYKVMISLKVKNYILVGYDGRKVFRGASVRSRADERFGREFIAQAVDLLINKEPEKVSELYAFVASQIESRQLPLEKFVRRERVTEKTFTSSAKRRSAEVAKGARVGEHISVYQKEDGSLGLAEDYAGDEDQDYLLDKLYKFASRLREAFGDDFEQLFPKPSDRTRAEAAGQQKMTFE